MVHKQCKRAMSSSHGWSLGMLCKVCVAGAVCLVGGLLLAQAPAGPAAAVQEDAQGVKYQVPLEAFTNPKNKGKLNEHKLKIRGIVTGSPSSINDAASKAMVEQYYLQYAVPMMTTEEGLRTIAADRASFMRDLAGAKDPAAHTYVAGLALSALSKIVPDNYRQASRYNAMLIISSLNDVEPALPQTLPEPMRAALPFILQQFQKADNPDSVKLAALLGLSRHLEFDNYRQPANAIPAALKGEIIKELTAVAQSAEPPDGRDSEVHLWFRRRAIEALALACLTKPDAEIAANLHALLVDDGTALSVRGAAAAALGKMSLQAPVKLDPVATAKELGYVALLVCDAELTKAENFRKAEYEHEARLAGTYSGEMGGGMTGPGMTSGRPGAMGMPGSDGAGVRGPLRAAPSTSLPGGEYGPGGMSGEYGPGFDPSMLDPKHYRLEYTRRRIRQQLYAVQLGLTGGEDFVEPKRGSTPPAEKAGGPTNPRDAEKRGMLVLAKANEREAVLGIYYKVRNLVQFVESTAQTVELPALTKTMRDEMKNLEAITKKLPPPGAVAGGAPGEEDPTVPAVPKPKVAGGGKAKGGVGAPNKKGAPSPAGKRPPMPGKSASRPPTPAPVFGRPPNR